MAKMSDSTKQLVIAGTIVVVAVGGVIAYSRIKKYLWEKGRDRTGKGKGDLYAYVGDQGYANLRATPQIKFEKDWKFNLLKYTSAFGNLASAALEMSDNLMGKVTKGRIGKILDTKEGSEGYRWYLVALDKPVKWNDKTFKNAYVREDVVITKKIEA